MSIETKFGFLDKEMTRRQFMKISGKSLAGLTLSASMLKLIGCTQEQVQQIQEEEAPPPEITVTATPQGLLVVNADLCVGCVRCETNCTTVNDGAPSYYNSRLKVTRNLMSNKNGIGMLADLETGWVYYPDTCRHCYPAPCAEICPVGAISPDIRGVQLVDENTCIGCGVCNTVCPWEMINVSTFSGKAAKCNMCEECVKGCPSGALKIVPWSAVESAAQQEWQG